MSFWQTIKKWLADACVWFTCFSVFLMFFSLVLTDTTAISSIRFLLLFVSGLCFSLAGMIKRSGRLPFVARVLLHYIIDSLSIFLFLYLPTSVKQAATRLLMFLLISLVYWLIIGTIALIRSRIRKLMEEE